MQQLHRRFTDEQVKVLFQGYRQGVLARDEIQEMLEVGKTQFFALLKEYRRNPESFSEVDPILWTTKWPKEMKHFVVRSPLPPSRKGRKGQKQPFLPPRRV